MHFDAHQPPRRFSPHPDISLTDVGDLYLGVDEQVTVRVDGTRGNDVVRKPWGFYLTNSLNGTLRAHRMKTALARNVGSGRLYVMLVEDDKVSEFQAYLAEFGMQLLAWLDEWPEAPAR